MATPETAAPRGRGVLAAAALAFTGGVAALVTVFVLGQQYLDAVQRTCNWPQPSTEPRLSVAAPTLGIVATVLMIGAVGLGALAGRRLGRSRWAMLAGLLIVAGILGALCSGWFGIAATLPDLDGPGPHCGG